MKNKELKDFIHNNVYQNTSTGYVLTPSELAFEMIQTLPKSVFKSESTTFLDPICKSGTFLFEIIEELYENGHSIKNIESRVFTIDGNSHSLNVANSSIKKILNKLSGSFKIDYKYEFIERYYNRLISSISKGKYTTFDDFLSIIIVDKTNKELMKELQKNISEFIEKYEKVSRLESKLFGEVFTPRKLIDEMLDTLPEDVWKNKDLKWLDPAVGIGNFPAAILDRLMIGLSDEFKDELERKKHILEEMLHFCDISIKNLFLLYKLFDCNNEFKLNVYRGSFLTDDFDRHMREVWGLERFDIIISNPPYQSSTSDENSANSLWVKFLEKSSNIYKNYLLYITPNSWLGNEKLTDADSGRMTVNKVRSRIIDKNSLLLVNYGKRINNYFNVGLDFSYYLIGKKSNSLTKINGVDINYEELPFIPLDINSISIIKKILKLENLKIEKNLNPTFESDTRKWKGLVSKEKTDIHIYPICNTSAQYNKEIYLWSSIKHGETNTSKVIMSDSGYLRPFYDSGNFGISSHSLFVRVKNEIEGKSLISYLNSKFLRFLSNMKPNSGSEVNILKIRNLIPKVELSKVWTNQEIYEYFNLTEEEIDLIEKTIKD